MKAYLYTRNTVVLIILTSLTIISWAVSLEGISLSGNLLNTGAQISGAFVMLLAFFKVHLVIRNFMEVRHAPVLLKMITTAWVVVASTAVVVCYLGVLA